MNKFMREFSLGTVLASVTVKVGPNLKRKPSLLANTGSRNLIDASAGGSVGM